MKTVLRLLGLLCIAVVLFAGVRIWRVLNPARRLLLKDGVDQSYAGRYADDPRYLELLSSAPKLRNDALLDIQSRLNSDVSSYFPLLAVRFSDLEEDFGQHDSVFGHGKFYGVAEIDVGAALNQEVDVSKEMKHELTHTIMDLAMRTGFKQLPLWVQEGSAVWMAEQVDSMLETYVQQALTHDVDPLSLIDGLETEPHEPQDYVEDGLFFAYIEDRFGRERVQRILNRIIWREPYREVFEQELGVTWTELQHRAKSYALQEVTSAVLAHRDNEK